MKLIYSGRTLSFDELKVAVERIKEFCSVKDFCERFNLNYDELLFYEIVPKEIELLVKKKKLPLEIAGFLVTQTNFDDEKKIRVAGYYSRKRNPSADGFNTLLIVMKDFERKEKRRIEKERKEEQEVNDYWNNIK